MPSLVRLGLLAALALAAAPVHAAEPTAAFPLKEGDIWVMAGDSITAQHLHSNYFEAFCFARYPKLKFAFRNSGVGGHTIPTTLARFHYDVAAWKPTVVSVELGMNDKGGYTVEKYIANMGKMREAIKAAGARPVFFTASPVNDGSTTGHLQGGNGRLDQYAVALKKFAAEHHDPFADQFHDLLDIWGKNKPRENVARILPGIKALAANDKVVGVEHLRAFLEAQAKIPHPAVSMEGDPVHPGPPGQLMMAAALLNDLGAEGFVSSVVIDGGKVVEAKGCTVEGMKAGGDTLAFDRLDESIPFPIPDSARAVVPLYPTILKLSQYGLKVTGLPGERYELKINGKPVATLTAKELARGVNLAAYGKGALADQGKEVLNAVAAKEVLVGQWRGLSRTISMSKKPEGGKDAEALAALTKKVEAADAKIRKAAQPRKLHFELSPAK